MSAVSQLAALVTALIHLQVFAFESVLWSRPSVHRRFGIRSAADAATIRPVMLNQGFYNLFLALGILTGLIIVHSGPCLTAGRWWSSAARRSSAPRRCCSRPTARWPGPR